VAARRGQEKIDNAKYRYGEEAYNETRARNLWEVEKGWEEPVHQYGQAVTPLQTRSPEMQAVRPGSRPS